MSTLAIDVHHVTKRFGSTTALNAVSMRVEAGESRALAGRNGAGKSTLIGLLVGMDRPDGGRVEINGLPAAVARDRGIVAFVPQKSLLFPALSAAENVMMGHQVTRGGGLICRRATRARAIEALSGWGLQELADQPVEQLDQVQRKVVEICRATLTDPAVLLLDEPTAGLDRGDAERLFTEIDRLRHRAVTIVYVSHHLHEVYRICDSATVLRDARHVCTESLKKLPLDSLVAAMVGSEAATPTPTPARRAAIVERPQSESPALFQARHISEPGLVHDVSLQIQAGECVGLAGIDGSGKMALADALVGRAPRSSGEVLVGGTFVPAGSVARALAAGIGFVPADRHAHGMVPTLDVAENATLSALPTLSRRLGRIGPRLVRRRARDKRFAVLQRDWKIVSASPRQLIGELSGGNQQKCVLARGLATDPDVLVLMNPTAGVDVAAKASITTSIGAVLKRGAAVLVVSEDADDFALCSRILVMGHGRIVTQLGSEWSDEQLNNAMQGAAA